MTTYVSQDNQVIARGTIKPQLIDIVFNDGTRYFSTKSDGYTLDFLKNLQIAKVVK
jgi:hypothetical protein